MFRSNVAFLTCLAVIALQVFDWRRSNAQGDPRLQRPSAQTPKTNQDKRDFSIRTIPRNSIGHRCSGYGCYCNNNQEVVWRGQIVSQVEILVNGKVVGKARASGMHPQATNIVFPAYGTEYEIRVSNMKRFWNTRMQNDFRTLAPERRLFDIEVDGLSVMNGKPRAGRPHGYIVKAGRSTTIRGWRIDDQAVRRFMVARPVESVAAAENTMNQIGNIKVRVYRERPLPVTFYGGLKM